MASHLCEIDALGAGQSVQAQGIVHGGGKYALRNVGDIDAMRAIRDMPERWRAHHSGTAGAPDLRGAHLLSDACWLWLPKGSWMARLQALGLLPVLRHGRVLACPPEPRPRDEWPEVLRRHAQRALRMAEPVFDTRSVLAALREPVVDRLLRVAPVESGSTTGSFRRTDSGWEVDLRSPDGESLTVRTSAVVFTAGSGNADLLGASEGDRTSMQERPLQMAVVRGDLPRLHAHCIGGGKTRITVTSVDTDEGTVWQVGGELAERCATADAETIRREAVRELRACLPGLDLSGVRLTSYRAVRAEARDRDARRPSGAHVRSTAARAIVAWPTKWALAPLLAEDVLAELRRQGVQPSGPRPLHGSGRWPRPDVAPYPWEQCAWTELPSAERV